MPEFRLPVYVQNNGDGSASVIVCESFEDAQAGDEAQDEGFAEASAENLKLKVEDGKLYFYDTVRNNQGKYVPIWREVKQ